MANDRRINISSDAPWTRQLPPGLKDAMENPASLPEPSDTKAPSDTYAGRMRGPDVPQGGLFYPDRRRHFGR